MSRRSRVQLSATAVESNLMGLWSETSAFQFDDGTRQTWIQAFPLGVYDHPLHGQIDITPERVDNFIQNFNEGVRDTDLDIDYDHKEDTGKAAGWIRQMENRDDDGLWFLVEWTEAGYSALKNKEYRYFSPEFADAWTHPKSGKTFTDVVFGGAITNRPFLKDILPINLSEITRAPTPVQRGGRVDPTKLRATLGLAEDATDEQVETKLSELMKPPPAPEPTPTVVEASESKKKLKKLAETNPDVAAMLAVQESQAQRLAEQEKRTLQLEAANKLSEINLELNELDQGKKFAVPPTTKEGLRKVLVGMTKEDRADLLKAFSDTLEAGVVELGERGGIKPTKTGADASQTLATYVEEAIKASEGKLTYVDAVTQVTASHPELLTEYRGDAYLTGAR